MKRKLAEHRVPLLSNAWQYNTRTLWCLWWHHEERCFQFNENPSFQGRWGGAVANRINGWETCPQGTKFYYYINVNTLTSSMVFWINCGVTAKISRHYTENVCKISLKTSPHLSQCFQHTSLSLQVSVKIMDSSTWLWTSQSVMFLQVTAALSMPSPWAQLKTETLHLDLRGNCPQSWASPGTVGGGRAGGGVGEPFCPLRSSHHSLSLTDGCAVLPPPPFSSLSLAKHPPYASRSSPATIHPAITLNSSLTFWDVPASPLFSILLV